MNSSTRTSLEGNSVEVSRRSFMAKSAGVATVGMLIGTSKSWAGANDRIRVAVAGLHGRGGSHVRGFSEAENVEVVALCDPDEEQIKKRSDELVNANKPKPKEFVDVRELLDDDSIDVLAIATPNHWHSLMAIWACQAGKDVYVEKPLSHNVWEGRQLVNAARKYNRIVQHGTQSRTSPGVREGIRRLHDGEIGTVYMAKGMCYKWRDTIGHTPEEPVPSGVHYDLWIGPAPERPFTRNRFHYNWHWQWEYGNGDIGNQGVHEMDMARWGLGVQLPKRIQAMGGHYLFNDDQTTPNTLVATFEYPDEQKMLVFEVRHWITNFEGGIGSGTSNNVGVIYYGSDGFMVMKGDGYQLYQGKERKEGPKRYEGGNHFVNFLQAVRERNPALLNADVEEGHLSSALCHLANIAYRTGRTIHFDPEKETVIGDREARRIWDDSDRRYRKPYVVPKNV